MRIVIMGPPGAGKGTQAQVISRTLGIPHISTGEIFRENARAGTEMGLKAREYMERGEYVPDTIVNAMIEARLRQPDAAKGFLLDGYPRTEIQVEELNRILAAQGTKLDRAVEITADTEEVVRRLLHRAEIEGRADDTEDVIRRRMQVYAAETEPLTRMYARQGVMVQVDGMGSVKEVSDRVLAALRG